MTTIFERRVEADTQVAHALDQADGGGQRRIEAHAGSAAVVRTDFERQPAGDAHVPSALEGVGGDLQPREAHATPVTADPEDFERHQAGDTHSAAALDDADGGGRPSLDARLDHATAVREQDFERHRIHDPQKHIALEGVGGDQEIRDARTVSVAADPTIALRLAADTLLDVERLRIATENRIRALGDIPGWSITPAALRWASHLTALQQLERQVTRELEHAMKRHPLGPFVQRTVGLGLKQTGRLVGALGDPSWNALEGRPRRGPAELWAFAGYAPAQKRRKGERANWSAEVKMRAYLVAESCIKQVGTTGAADPGRKPRRPSPYRAVYDAARANWRDREVSDAHKHAHALRLVAKAVLRDLWVESMRLRTET